MACLSLADHDSYMNYAERTNSAISDAMCVGTTIDCDIYNALDDLTVEEVGNLNSSKFKELSFKAQIKNSHHITNHLVQRLNGAPCLGNYITGRAGLSSEEQFLGFLKPFLPAILAASDLSQVPGGNFAIAVENYAASHSTKGLLYFELARGKCQVLEEKMCDKCLENPYKPGEKLITVPRPEVDTNNSSYKDVSVSSYQGRIVDDFLPS